MQQEGAMPSPGAWLTKIKHCQGVKDEVRTKAGFVLQCIERIPIHTVSYEQYSAAIRDAERMLAEEADEDKAFKTAKPSPSPEPRNDHKIKKGNEDVEKQKAAQDTLLTTNLRDNKVCLNYVAHQLSKGKACKFGDNCSYTHALPSTVGFNDADYADFLVVTEHLKSPDKIPDTTLPVSDS